MAEPIDETPERGRVSRTPAALPASVEIRRRFVLEPSVALAVLAVVTVAVGITGDWGGAFTPSGLGIVLVVFLAVLGVIAVWERNRAGFRARAASPLPDHFDLAVSRPVLGLSLVLRIAFVLVAIAAIRTLEPDLFDAGFVFVLACMQLGASMGLAIGTTLAVRRYERQRGRTLYIAAEAIRAPMFWREA